MQRPGLAGALVLPPVVLPPAPHSPYLAALAAAAAAAAASGAPTPGERATEGEALPLQRSQGHPPHPAGMDTTCDASDARNHAGPARNATTWENSGSSSTCQEGDSANVAPRGPSRSQAGGYLDAGVFHGAISSGNEAQASPAGPAWEGPHPTVP